MPHTYSDSLFHIVFSTKGRKEFDLSQTHAYIGGIARKNGMVAVCVGGTSDHVHILLQIPTTMDIAKAVQLIKGGSSKWLNEKCHGQHFSWQQGFAAFSVSRSNAKTVAAYVANQVEHHRKRNFEEEFRALLEKHGIKFDPKFTLDDQSSLRDLRLRDS